MGDELSFLGRKPKSPSSVRADLDQNDGCDPKYFYKKVELFSVVFTQVSMRKGFVSEMDP